MSTQFDGGSLERISEHTYGFVWPTGYYRTVFSVSSAGVIALDPINREAAAAYRRAVASVTDQPIRYVVYSHEHRDHIVGAEVLAPGAEIVAHRDIATLLVERGFTDIPLPTILVDGYHSLRLGDVTWELYDLGPNHSRTTLCVLDRADRWVAAIDLIAAGLVPYRCLPLTDFHGYIATLEKLETFDVDVVMDGHCPPATKEWIGNYRRYFADLLVATRKAREQVNELTIEASGEFSATNIEDGVGMTDRMFDRTAQLAAEAMRPVYGHWGGFDHWAPMNVERVLLYLITGE